jgi:hypothetical protein
MTRLILLAPVLFVAACAMPPQTATAPVAPPPTLDPTPPPPPPAAARTVEEFDTTSAEDRAAALAQPAVATEVELGTTIVSLGPPADPGIWLETPLVDSLVMGRVDYPAAGTSVALELRPSGGSPGSGSQISLAAMRLLEIPLTALAEVTVHRTGG